MQNEFYKIIISGRITFFMNKIMQKQNKVNIVFEGNLHSKNSMWGPLMHDV